MYKITDSFCKHIVNGFKQNKMVSYGKIALTHLLNKRKKEKKKEKLTPITEIKIT